MKLTVRFCGFGLLVQISRFSARCVSDGWGSSVGLEIFSDAQTVLYLQPPASSSVADSANVQLLGTTVMTAAILRVRKTWSIYRL
jgi:hypothetical protein